jgi:hypothetical protein
MLDFSTILALLPEPKMEDQILLFIPNSTTEKIGANINVNGSKFEVSLISNMLQSKVESLDQLKTINLSLFGWSLQICSTVAGKQNSRVSKIAQKEVLGNAIALLYYSKGQSKSTIKPADSIAKIETVVHELEQWDSYLTQTQLKHILHQRGFNMRHEWLLLEYFKNGYIKQLICADILLRVIKKLIRNSNLGCLIAICEYLNALFSGIEQQALIQEIMQALFFSSLRVIRFTKISEISLQNLLYTAIKNPSLLVSCVEHSFGVKMSGDLLMKVRRDKYLPFMLSEKDVLGVHSRVESILNSSDISFLLLAMTQICRGNKLPNFNCKQMNSTKLSKSP